MAVDPSKPFSRKSWNEDIIREVNELCENPDEGCDLLPILEEVDEDHIWLEEDVTEVQDKLIEICPENEFDDLKEPQLWHYDEIIVPIEEAIQRGWCNCEPEDTLYNFGYFPQKNFEAAHKATKANPTVVVTPTGCGGFETVTFNSPYYPVPSENEALNDIRVEARDAIRLTLQPEYSNTVYLVFTAEDLVKKLEEEVEVLENQIKAIEDDITSKEAEIKEATTLRDYYCIEGPPSNCTTYTALVKTLEGELTDLEDDLQVKESKLEVKEAELGAAETDLKSKIADRETARTEWDAAAQVMWAAFQSMELQWSEDIQPTRDLFPEMDEPWGDYWEDTRNKKPGQWTFYVDRHDDGANVVVMTGHFSPGGYPYYIGARTEYLSRIPNLCRYFDYTYVRDCICPWEIPYQGTDRCGGTTRIWWRKVLFGNLLILGEDCCCVDHDDWGLAVIVKHSPDYTRPSPE